MLRGTFLGFDRCENGHQDAPDKNERLWDPEYACPRVRDGEYLASRTSYGVPADVWESSLAQGYEFTFDLGTGVSTERERWRRYSPATDHELRTEANNLAREALVRWFRTPESPHARDSFMTAAEGSVQFRRLMMRYGLGESEPMKFDDIAKEERVDRKAVSRAITAAVASLPALSTVVEHDGLRAIAVQTVRMAEEVKFINDNDLDNGTLSNDSYREGKNMGTRKADFDDFDGIHELAEEFGGREADALLSGFSSNWTDDPDDFRGEDDSMREFTTIIETYRAGTHWSSDANSRPSLMDAYTDGWIARFEQVKDTACPFRNRKLRKKWHQGYREAAQELAARREADFSTP